MWSKGKAQYNPKPAQPEAMAQEDLFTSPPPEPSLAPAENHKPADTDAFRPMAERLRPHDLPDFYGQDAIVGEHSPLFQAMAQNQAHSCLLWGPPGVGKTTLASIYAQRLQAHFVYLSAVEAGVRELRVIIDKARARHANGVLTVLFLDEIHRFNKAQQDQLLPSVESGVLYLIGATTENPSFTLNNALLSRLRVYRMQSLPTKALEALLERALTDKAGVQQTLNGGALQLAPEQRCAIIHAADGDGRRLLSLLELAAQMATMDQQDVYRLSEQQLQQLLVDSPKRFDQQGDVFYDQISAMHKAIRGSDPDAGAYWLLRMLDGGADPGYLARRLVRIASEDIGNADPRALSVCIDAWTAFDRLGKPEGNLMLTQAAIYLAVAPKSNAVYNAHNALNRCIEEQASLEVPLHLRNAPTKLMAEQGFGAEYRYAHDYPDAYVPNEQYLPDDLHGQTFYTPVPRGLERTISERLAILKARDQNPQDGA